MFPLPSRALVQLEKRGGSRSATRMIRTFPTTSQFIYSDHVLSGFIHTCLLYNLRILSGTRILQSKAFQQISCHMERVGSSAATVTKHNLETPLVTELTARAAHTHAERLQNHML